MKRLLVGRFAAALTQAMPGAAAEPCAVAEIISPSQGSFVAQPRPPIEWRALPGVSRYRVQLESRVPEGRVLASIDSVVTELPRHRFLGELSSGLAFPWRACRYDDGHAAQRQHHGVQLQCRRGDDRLDRLFGAGR